ncbi:archaellar assembly protein FlaJ [Geoglobus acetivorans]|uniref:Archaellar assembly protein FlaJ n=1 Tax=Geoglobus acetivorans TaxID=565033 RepID=A0ABZ3H5L5_GEOAI|nr:archaellar assembly protein FlaJ [Geoglobus acetivorans]
MEFKTSKIFKTKKSFWQREINIPLFANIARKLKEMSEEKLMDNDLLFTLTYMASLSTANLSRDKIFELVAEKKEYSPSKYFKQIRDLTQKWHYDYATACELIAEKVKHKRLKELLNRFSNAIASGEPDEEFIEREWRTFKTVRKDEYQRSLESLRKWTDAYVSILVSTTLISVVILLSIVIYSVSDPLSMILTAIFSSLAFSLFGVFMLYKATPKDAKTHSMPIKSKEQMTISRLQVLLLPIFLAALLIFSVLPAVFNPEMEILGIDAKGIGLIISGFVLLPLGIIGYRDDRKISKRDEAFTSVIRGLGATISGAGVGMAEALSRLDKKNLGELKDLVMPLHKRLSLGLDPKISWDKFTGESGSYLISKLTPIFIDATDMGGDANLVGEIVGSSNLEMVLLRLKRDLISNGFINLVIPLHVSMVGLILFITKILEKFTSLISKMFESQLSTFGSASDIMSKTGLAGMNFGLFSAVPVGLFEMYALFVSLILILSNALSMKIVKGSANYMMYFYISILMILSGIIFIFVPIGVDWAFSFPSLAEAG